MDLAELKFVVDTKDLDDAAKKIDALGVAVSKVNKPITRATVDTEKLAKSQAEVAEASAKAALAQLKLQQAQENSTRVTGSSTTVLERQQMILQFMTDGFSKGQASQLAYAKAARASADDLEALGQVLQTQRKLMGTDPFDKSMGALQSLRNEYTVIKEVQRLYNAELGLSKSQMQDLAKEKLRLIEKLKIEGASFTDVKNGIMELNAAYLKNANAENSITSALRNKEKATLDAARANQYIIKETQRVNSLVDSQGSITSATNNALIRFERALKMSGISASEQVTKLEAYKQSLLSVQKAAGNRQVDYLSRALGPQITDIAVGLATGQSPLTVLLQQGGQLRDQFALAGVAGKDMGNMLVAATKNMVVSIKDVGVAIGSAITGAFLASGKSVNKFIGDITGVNTILETFRDKVALATGSNSMLSNALRSVSGILTVMTGTIVAGAVAAFIAYGVALKQVIDEESALSKSIALTGASLGVTQNSAMQLSKELAGTKGNVGAYITAITEIAKAGGVTSDNLKTVAKTIVDVSKVTGISAETLAKNFSKISEKPLEGLIPFAKELGTINVETLKQIDNLEKAGKKTEAVKLATDSYANSLSEAANTIRNEMGYLESFFFTIGDAAKSMWNSILNLGRKETTKDRLSEALGNLSDLQAGKGFMTNQYRKNSVQVAAATVSGILDEIAAEQKLADTKAKNSKDAGNLAEELKKRNEALTYYQGMIKDIAKIEADAIAPTDGLNAAQKKMVDFLNDPKFMAQSQVVREKAMADLVSASATIEKNKAEKQYANILREITILESEATAGTSKFNAAQKQIVKLINDPVFMAQTEEKRQEAIARVINASATIEENDALKNYTDILRDISKIESEATAGTYEFNAAQKEIVKLINDPKFMAQTEEKRKEAIARLTNASATIEEVKAQEILRKQNDDITKRYQERKTEQEKLGISLLQSSDKSTAAVRQETEMLDYQSSILSKTERERNKLVKIKQIELDLVKEEISLYNDNPGLSPDDREQLRVAAAQRAAIKIQNINKSITYEDDLARVQAYGQAFQNVFTGMADAIVEFAKTGKLNFKDLINSMITDLLRFELRKQATSMFEGFGGSAGIIKAATSLFTGTPVPSANGNVFSKSGLQAFAKGGAFTNTIVDSPTMFKFAKGTGLMGEAGPEAIMPLRRGADGSLGVAAAGGGSNVSVQVINNSNAQATTNETTDSKGNRKVEVIIGDMNASEISRSGSASQKSIKSTFGLQSQLIRR